MGLPRGDKGNLNLQLQPSLAPRVALSASLKQKRNLAGILWILEERGWMKPLVLTEGAGVPGVSEPMQCLDPFYPMNKTQELWVKVLKISEGIKFRGVPLCSAWLLVG